MDVGPEASHLAYTTPLAFAAYFFYLIPMLISDALRPHINTGTFLLGSFLQSLLLALLISGMLRSRWRQCNPLQDRRKIP